MSGYATLDRPRAALNLRPAMPVVPIERVRPDLTERVARLEEQLASAQGSLVLSAKQAAKWKATALAFQTQLETHPETVELRSQVQALTTQLKEKTADLGFAKQRLHELEMALTERQTTEFSLGIQAGFGADLPNLITSITVVTGVSLAEMRSERRSPRYVRARHIFSWLAHKLTLLSFTEIAEITARADHTTPLYGAGVCQGVADLAGVTHHQYRDDPEGLVRTLWLGDWKTAKGGNLRNIRRRIRKDLA